MKNKDAATELLLADHRYLCESFWRNEETGETRVKFFITLVTAVLAALVTLAKSANSAENNDAIIMIASYTLLALLIVGLVTLFRIIKRNKVTDEYKRGIDEIRQRFKDYFDDKDALLGYSPLGEPVKDKILAKEKISIRKFGGLSHTVAAINSLILALLVGIAVYKNGQMLLIISVFGAFSAVFCAQYRYLKYADKRNKAELQQSDITHAGGIVVRFENSNPQYLVITAKENTEHWVFPKGHIELREGHGEAAVREVLEETGVEARLTEPIGTSRFRKDDQKVTAKYYLMEYVANRREPEERKQKWCSYKEALEVLTFDDTKEFLHLAKYKTSFLKKTK